MIDTKDARSKDRAFFFGLTFDRETVVMVE